MRILAFYLSDYLKSASKFLVNLICLITISVRSGKLKAMGQAEAGFLLHMWVRSSVPKNRSQVYHVQKALEFFYI